MKKALSRCLFALLLLALGISAAMAENLPLMSLSAGDPTEGSALSFSWSGYSGASYYEYSVRDTTTNELHIDHKSTSGKSGSLSRSYIEAGHAYHIWVGAYNSAGTLIAQAHDDVRAICKYHDYNSKGVCVDCGAKCPHDDWDAKTGTCEDCGKACSHNGGVYESITKMNYKSISSSKHKITITYSKKCDICFYAFETGLTRTKEEAHNFDKNGDCKDCDYRAVCQHTRTEYVLRDGYPAYSTHNEEKHKVDKQYSKICSDCGKVIEQFADDARTIDYQAHSFNSKNTCTKCGYVKPAAQKPLSVSVSCSASSSEEGAVLNADCTATGGSGSYQYAWTIYCNGVVIDDSAYGTIGNSRAWRTDAPGTWSLTVYVRDTSTGAEKTASTGGIVLQKKPCAHTNTSDVPSGSPAYRELNEEKHEITQKYQKVCDQCGDIVSTFDSTANDSHFFVNGFCSLCGAAQPACPHDYQQVTVKVTYGQKVGDKNSNTHTEIVEYYAVCSLCGDRTSNQTKTVPNVPHSYTYIGGHEKDHPHAVFNRCDCGWALYTGEYRKLQNCPQCFPATPAPVTPPPVTPGPTEALPAIDRMDAIREIDGEIKMCKGDPAKAEAIKEKISKYQEQGVFDIATQNRLLTNLYDFINTNSEYADSRIALSSYEKTGTGEGYRHDISLAMIEMCDIAYSFNDKKLTWDESKLKELGFSHSTYLEDPEVLVTSKLNDYGEPVVIIAFRGTQTPGEWAMDLHAGTTDDDRHFGFDTYVKRFEKKIWGVDVGHGGIEKNTVFKDIVDQAMNGERVHILVTGHSLGGAKAQLFVYDMMEYGVPLSCITGYTYASPYPIELQDGKDGQGHILFKQNDLRNAPNQMLLSIAPANIFNVVNANDLVPAVGASVVNGERIGRDILIYSEKLRTDIKGLHLLDTYREAIQNAQYYIDRN